MNWIEWLDWQAVTTPDLPALQDDRGEAYTYSEFQRSVVDRSNTWAARGVSEGDIVCVVERNSARYFLDVFSLARIGAIAALVNWRLDPREIDALVELVSPVAIVTEPDLIDKVADLERLPPLRVARADVDVPHWLTDDELLATPVDVEAVPVVGEAFVLGFSSGTTGRPKAIPLTHRGLMRSAVFDVRDSGMGLGDVHLINIPTFHLAGLINSLMGLVHGGTLHLQREFDAAATLEIIERERVQYTTAVPATVDALVREARRSDPPRDLGSLVEISYGAAPISPQLVREAIEVLGCGFRQYYGMTETAGAISALTPASHDPEQPDVLRSAGRVNLGWEYRIVEPSGADVEVGLAGELLIRGDALFPGYWRDEEATAAVMEEGGWFHTGDIVTEGPPGFVTVVDRAKDTIISGGENVYPVEVELQLLEHPQIAEASVIGVPSERWGESVHAIVVLEAEASLDEAEIIGWVRSRIAHFKAPRSVSFSAELPRNATGKVLRRQLRDPYWVGQERSI